MGGKWEIGKRMGGGRPTPNFLTAFNAATLEAIWCGVPIGKLEKSISNSAGKLTSAPPTYDQQIERTDEENFYFPQRTWLVARMCVVTSKFPRRDVYFWHFFLYIAQMESDDFFNWNLFGDQLTSICIKVMCVNVATTFCKCALPQQHKIFPDKNIAQIWTI